MPIKTDESQGGDVELFASIHGLKFCDLYLGGSCSEEPLVNGTTITVDFATKFENGQDDGMRQVMLSTGLDEMSMASIGKQGNDIDIFFSPGSAGPGEYWVDFDCAIVPGATGNGDGAMTTLMITETLAAAFDLQTAPADGMDDGMGVTTEPAANGTIKYTVVLDCNEDKEGLDFGNITLDPAEGNPHTIGFWGANLIKSAINSDPAAHDQCGDDEAPGNNMLPVSDGMTTYYTPDQVATLIMDAAMDCAAFDATINDPDVDTTEEKLCEAAGHLPPKQFDNPLGQLLGALLNVESGLLPAGAFVNWQCLGIGNDPTPVPLSGILANACDSADLSAYQALLDAINNLDPADGFLGDCLTVPTCPTDTAIIPGGQCLQ